MVVENIAFSTWNWINRENKLKSKVREENVTLLAFFCIFYFIEISTTAKTEGK